MSTSHSFRASDDFNGKKAFSIRFQHRVQKEIAEGERFYFAFCYPYSYAEYQARLGALDAYFTGRLSRNFPVPRRLRLSGTPIDPLRLASTRRAEGDDDDEGEEADDGEDEKAKGEFEQDEGKRQAGKEEEERTASSPGYVTPSHAHCSPAAASLAETGLAVGNEAFRKASASSRAPSLIYYYRELLGTSKQGTSARAGGKREGSEKVGKGR